MRAILFFTALTMLGCAIGMDGSSSATDPTPANNNAGDAAPDGGDASTMGASCTSSELVVILGRNGSMANAPDGTKPTNDPQGWGSSKWGIAVTAIDKLATTPGIRFGLELYPDSNAGNGMVMVGDGGGPGSCQTLPSILGGTLPTNLGCRPGEILVPMEDGNGAKMSSAITIDTTKLCNARPIAAALATATNAVTMDIRPKRSQAAVLITDGSDTCDGNGGPAAIDLVANLSALGIPTHIVGLGKAPGLSTLNDLACAAHTAKDFANACVLGQTTYVAKDPKAPPMFATAMDESSLTSALQEVMKTVKCN